MYYRSTVTAVLSCGMQTMQHYAAQVCVLTYLYHPSTRGSLAFGSDPAAAPQCVALIVSNLNSLNYHLRKKLFME